MVSIIVPVYNIEQYLDRCIASLVSQTYRDLEILLVDDGSTDSSCTRCRNWCLQDSRIKVYSQPNQGVGAARNIGIARSTGDFLMFVDGDDRITPSCIEDMMAAMTPETDIVCCGCSLEKEDPSMGDCFDFGSRSGKVSPEEYFRDLYDCILYTQTIWAKIFRKRLWENIQFEKLKNGEDSLAMLQLFQKSPRVYMLPEAHYLYLQRLAGASKIQDRESCICQLYVRNQAFQTALASFPQYRSKAGSLYIATAYCLLKRYAADNNKQEAIALIHNMKATFASADIPHPTRSQRLLRLPAPVIYCLICLKCRIKGGI